MKKMIFKFAGGPLDGKIVVGESGKEKEVRRYDALTNHGANWATISHSFRLRHRVSHQQQLQEEKPHHFQQYSYEVVDRFDNGDVLIVLIQHVEQAAGRG